MSNGSPPNALVELARAIADWAHPELTIYVYGSRVRGDNRPDSDVDMHYVLPARPSREFTVWWTEQNGHDFADLRKVLPGRPQFLESDDPLYREIEAGTVVHRDRNVICIDRPPKPKPPP
jgi:predicted nucleotidyltransferase